MKTKKYRNVIFNILTFLLILLEWYLHTFINEFIGIYSLINKGIDVLLILFIIVLLFIIIIQRIKEYKSKKFTTINVLLILILISVLYHFISQGIEKAPNIITDIKEGRHSSSLQLNGTATITDSLFGYTRYRISGVTPEGKELSFAVSDEDFVGITNTNSINNIRINYWEHTSTLYVWEPID